MKKILSRYKRIALDTNIFIYYLDRSSQFYSQSDRFFQKIISNKNKLVTSVITLTEVLSFKAPKENIDRLEQELTLLTNLKIIDVNSIIAIEAARIRREYKYRLPDAIQLATAKYAKAQAFFTNDDRLEKFKELAVIMLKTI